MTNVNGTVDINMTVDGKPVSCAVEPRLLLAHLLTDVLDRTGVNVGCDSSNCGACTVLLDGRSTKSCTVLAVQADDREVTTIAGLGGLARRAGLDADDGWHILQREFRRAFALQCGYCTPGMIMAAVDLLASNPAPTDAEIRSGLEGNLCRCTGYASIVEAVARAAASDGESD